MPKETWHQKRIRKMVNDPSLTDNEAAQLIARLDYIRRHPDPSFIEDREGNITPLKELRPLSKYRYATEADKETITAMDKADQDVR